MAPRGPQDRPKRPGPETAFRGPGKAPRGPQDGSKRAPRWLQEGTSRYRFKLRQTKFDRGLTEPLPEASWGLQKAPPQPQEIPQMASSGVSVSPWPNSRRGGRLSRALRGPSEGPKRGCTLFPPPSCSHLEAFLLSSPFSSWGGMRGVVRAFLHRQPKSYIPRPASSRPPTNTLQTSRSWTPTFP